MQLRHTFILLVFLLAAILTLPLAAQDNEVRKPKQKRPLQITQPLTSNTEAAILLQQAIQEEQSGNTAQAIKQYRAIIKNYPLANEAPEAQLLLAQLFQKRNELRRAFDAYQSLITRYPEDRRFDEAIAQQIIIANFYLDKRNNAVSNLLMSNVESAQHMYEKILASAPFGRYAPIIQFNLGLAHERQGHVQDAVQAYQTLIDKYPNSSIVKNAQYQIAYVYMRVGLNKTSQDLSALLLAKDYFQDYTLQYPDNERALQIQKNIQSIGIKESANIYNIARFYDNNRDFKAAFIYYNDVIRLQSSSPEALLAKARIESIRSEVGDDALRAGPDKAETGRTASVHRRLQAQVETQALPDYAGPSRKDILPDELPVAKPKMRTGERSIPLMP